MYSFLKDFLVMMKFFVLILRFTTSGWYPFQIYSLKQLCLLWSESPSGKCAKLHTVAANNNRDDMPWSLSCCLFMPCIYGCCSSHTSRSWWVAHSTQCQLRDCNNILSFLQQTAVIAHSFCEGCTWYDLHILVTAPFCCDQKAQAASAQSFTLWQQATIEITCHDHSIIACSRHIYMGVILPAHPVRGESHIQCNANWEVATCPTEIVYWSKNYITILTKATHWMTSMRAAHLRVTVILANEI